MKEILLKPLVLLIGLTILPKFLLEGMDYLLENKGTRKSEIISNSINIYSVKSKIGIEGDFTLGFGRIQEKDYYIFLVRHNGGFIRKQIPTDETLIIESTELPSLKTNRIVNTKYVRRGEWIEIKDTFDYKDKYKAFVQPIKGDLGYKYILHIPKGSITENQIYEVL